MTGVATASELPTYVLAHGIGDRQDLPLPFGYVLAGAGAALVVSFLALGLLWRRPRLGRPGAGVPLPAGVARVLDSTAFAVGLRLLGLLVTAYVGVAAVLGPDLSLNPTAGAVYVLLWGGRAAGLGAAGTDLAGAEPAADRARRAGAAVADQAGAGAGRVAAVGRLLAGGGRAARVPLAGADRSRRRDAAGDPHLVPGLRRRAPVRGGGLRLPVVRPG